MSLLKEVCNRLIDEKINFEVCFYDGSDDAYIYHPFWVNDEDDEEKGDYDYLCIAIKNGQIIKDGNLVNCGIICTLDEAISYFKDEAT